MRNAALLAGAVVALGIGATATLATGPPEDSSLFGANSTGAVVLVTKARIDGVGKVWARCSSDAAGLGIDAMVTATDDAVLTFGGWMWQDIKGGDGVVTSTLSLTANIPISKLKDRRGKLTNKPDELVESPFIYDLERFVNGSMVTTTYGTEPWEPWEVRVNPPIIVPARKRKPSKVLLGGAISLSSVKTSGVVKTNRRIAKLKAKVVIRFQGYVISGPHAGREIKGTVKVSYKGAVAD